MAGKQEESSDSERRGLKCRQGAEGVTPSPHRTSTKPPSRDPDVQTARSLNIDKNETHSELSIEGPGRILIVLNFGLLGIRVLEKTQKEKRISSEFLSSCPLCIKYP